MIVLYTEVRVFTRIKQGLPPSEATGLPRASVLKSASNRGRTAGHGNYFPFFPTRNLTPQATRLSCCVSLERAMTFKQVGHHCEAFCFDGVVGFVIGIFDKLRVTSLSGMSYASFGINSSEEW